MTETKERRKRKPKDLRDVGPIYSAGLEDVGVMKNRGVYIVQKESYYAGDGYLNAEHCRRLAKWLNDASDYLEARKK